MVWSLSKDDDGLDSVLPLADEDPGIRPRISSPGDGNRAPSRAANGGSTLSSTVVVDPSSQVPESHGGHVLRKRTIEPTLVLKGRNLDNLRAEVARQRVAHQRKKQRVLLLWAGAGGLAMCLGWAVGMAFRPASTADALELDVPSEQSPTAAASVTAGVAPRVTSAKSPDSAEADDVPQQGASTFSLADLPADEASDEADDSGADGLEQGSGDEPEKSGGDAPQAGEALTLDDLPAD